MKKIIFVLIASFLFISAGNAVIKDSIFATVGNKVITKSDIINEIKIILILNGTSYSEEIKDQLDQSAIQSIIKRTIKKIEVENNAVSFLFNSLPKNLTANIFIEKVEGLSKKSPFNVKAKIWGASSLSVEFSGATIKNVVELSLLFDSLFSSIRTK